jgi:hypothetical protein
LGVSGFSLYNYYFVTEFIKSKDWSALSAYLHIHVEPDDLVIQASADAAFGFYFDKRADDMALPANPQQSRDDIIQILTRGRQRYKSMWLVGQTFPDWPNAGLVEAWLNGTMQRVRTTQIAGLRIEQYMDWDVNETEYADNLLATFGDIAELADFEVFAPPEPGGELTIWVYWRALRGSDTPLKVFVHLIDATNPASGTPVLTQDDQFPQDGRISTTDWTPESVYRDVYSLPASTVPAGDYRVLIGYYDPETGERLPVNGGDSHILQSVHLP